MSRSPISSKLRSPSCRVGTSGLLLLCGAASTACEEPVRRFASRLEPDASMVLTTDAGHKEAGVAPGTGNFHPNAGTITSTASAHSAPGTQAAKPGEADASAADAPTSSTAHGTTSGVVACDAGCALEAGLPPCSDGSFYPDGSSTTACRAWAGCEPGTFIAPADASAGEATCAPCPASHFSAGGDASACTPWTDCGWATATPGTPTSDAECGPSLLYHQFGTETTDVGGGIAVDPQGYVYVVGSTYGALEGTNVNLDDVFIRKYDPDGTLSWTRQFGTPGKDAASAVAVVGSHIYVVGNTDAALDGTHQGRVDQFLRQYDANGNLLWARQFGTEENEWGMALAGGDTDVYVVGYTNGTLHGPRDGSNGSNAYIRRYDSAGNVTWSSQFGSTGSDDIASGAAVTSGGDLYVVGSTSGPLVGPNYGSRDAFIRHYDKNGQLVWAEQFGTEESDAADAVAIGPTGEFYIMGVAYTPVPDRESGDPNLFLRRYDSDGVVRWTRQFGTNDSDFGIGLAVSQTGDIYVGAYSWGALDGFTNAGLSDPVVFRYSPSGEPLQVHQFGTADYDYARGIAAHPNGPVFLLADGPGALPGQFPKGYSDVFVLQLLP